jgi:coenzyme F420-reducing hydrogenase beta subunit
MKQKCSNCGADNWTRLTMRIEKQMWITYCSECKAPVQHDNLPYLGSGAKNKSKRITPGQYKEACERANRTGKPVDL